MQPRYNIEVQLTGENGNIYSLLSIVTHAIKGEGASRKECDDLFNEIRHSNSYEEALNVLATWVHVQ